MDAFRRNQAQFRTAMEGAFSGGPFAEIAKRNMEMFEAASTAFKGKVAKGDAAVATPPATTAPAPAASGELEALKAQLAAMQDKIDKLAH